VKKESTITSKPLAYFIIESCTDTISDNLKLYQAGLIAEGVRDDSSGPPHPEHIPPIILYLCTEHAAGINGHVFGASGGRIALYSNPTEIKSLYKEGVWTVDELIKRVPSSWAQGLVKARGSCTIKGIDNEQGLLSSNKSKETGEYGKSEIDTMPDQCIYH
jgi:hypothetical protein